jgi:hypothetical protein
LGEVQYADPRIGAVQYQASDPDQAISITYELYPIIGFRLASIQLDNPHNTRNT